MSESSALLQHAVDSAREEARQGAARLNAIGEFVEAEIRADGGRSDDWAVDAVGAATVDIAAALRISRGLADWQVRYAYALRHQLPMLGQRFLAGDIDENAFRTAAFRTGLVLDPDIRACIDAALADRMPRWGSVERSDMHNRIDKIVSDVDLDAVRRREKSRDERGVTVTPLGHGLSEISVITTAINAATTSARLTSLAHSVCENDPRSLAERRVDAHDAAIQGQDRLSCRCGHDDCPAGGIIVRPVDIHVVGDVAGLTAPPDSAAESDEAGDAETPDPVDTSAARPTAQRRPVGAIVPGCDGLFPPELIAEIAAEARLHPVVHPGDAGPEPG